MFVLMGIIVLALGFIPLNQTLYLWSRWDSEAVGREDFAAAGEHLAELSRLINQIPDQIKE